MTTNEELWQRIKRLREAKGLSVYRLAQLMDVKTPTAQQWEKPKEERGTAPRRHRVAELARILGVSVAELEYGPSGHIQTEAANRDSLTPDEQQLVTMYRAVIESVRRDVWRQLEQAYDVAIQYERKYLATPKSGSAVRASVRESRERFGAKKISPQRKVK